MTDDDKFLAAILANPHDDTPRLVYADWLDDRGDPEAAARAEFIRVQCELAAWKPYQAPPEILEIANSGRLYSQMAAEQIEDTAREHQDRHDALRRREGELFGRHKAAWFGGDRWAIYLLPGDEVVHDGLTHALVRRGFVGKVTCTLAAFAGCAEALFRAHPVERVTLSGRTPHWNGRAYCWYRAARSRRSGAVPEAAELPADLYAHLATHPPKPVTWAETDRFVGWDATEDAQTVLAATAVNRGRRLAGLPALPG